MTYPNFLSCFALGISSSFFGGGLLFEKVHDCNCFGAGVGVSMDRPYAVKKVDRQRKEVRKRIESIHETNQQTTPLQSLGPPSFYLFFVGLSKIKSRANKINSPYSCGYLFVNESMGSYSLSSQQNTAMARRTLAILLFCWDLGLGACLVLLVVFSTDTPGLGTDFT